MRKGPVIFLLAAVVLFLGGLLHLFNLRFEAGDIYPPYSSLRADPLGTKALYESLEGLRDVRRNYRPLVRVGEGRGATLLYLGAEYEDLNLVEDEFRILEAFAADGGRLVIALSPRYQRTTGLRLSPKPQPAPSGRPPPAARKGPPPGKPPRSPVKKQDEDLPAPLLSFADRWDLDLKYAAVLKDPQGAVKPATVRCLIDGRLPQTIAWHSAAYFQARSNVWRTVYAREKEGAVVIEREFGGGSIVVLADSYLFSNEALRKDRQPALLSWLLGSAREVVVNETHLGVMEDPGIAALARKYRLHGFAVALLVLAGLLVWKEAARFMPVVGAELARDRGEAVAGRDTAAGLVNLLRRNLPPTVLLAACVAEWKRTCAHLVSAERLRKMQALIEAENALEPRRRDPVGTYRKFCEILSRTRFK